MDADALAVVLGKEPEWAGQVRSLPGKRETHSYRCSSTLLRPYAW